MSNHTDEVFDRLEAMRAQEDATSTCYNYLKRSRQDIDQTCRTSMITWCQQVQKALRFSPETVWLATSFFDRYLSSGKGNSRAALQDRYEFQLAAVASFYTAVKINESKVLNVATLAKMCQGYYEVSDILSVEEDILFALDWRVSNSHTPMEFVRQLIEILPVKPDGLEEACQRNMDRTGTNFYFTFCKPSVVGASCLASALTEGDILNSTQRQAFWLQLADITDLMGVMEAQSKLYEVKPIKKSKVSKKSSSKKSSSVATSKKSSVYSQPRKLVASGDTSPVCVTRSARQA